MGSSGWPQLHATDGFYEGPLPRKCSCPTPHRQLIAKDEDGNFLTTAAAAYPPRLDELFATALWQFISSSHRLKRANTLAADEAKLEDPEIKNDIKAKNDVVAEEDFVSKNDMVVDKGFVTKSVEVSQNDLAKENLEKKSLAKGSQSLDMGSHRPQKAPRRSQLEVWYKGRFRRTADGLGKRSPGIRTSSSRSRSKSK